MNTHPDLCARKPSALFVLDHTACESIYGEPERADIQRLTNLLDPSLLTAKNWRSHPDVCRKTEVIFSGWGVPQMNEEFLDAFPSLKAVFYGAGSVKPFTTDALWERGIIVSSAYAANAVPVCEFTVAQIVLSAKHVWRLALATRQARVFPPPAGRVSAGMYGSTIGLISLGMIGRLVAQRLKTYGVRLIAYDPVIDPLEAAKLGIELCSLEAVFKQSDVVSCHTPLLPETIAMLRREHFASMKPNATFINTARGAIVHEQEMIEVLKEREGDLWALLDVTAPIPPDPDSELYSLPNVLLTPHIAGSIGEECRRLGRTMVEEFERYLTGSPLLYGICREQSLQMA